jgi:hypothetical protein
MMADHTLARFAHLSAAADGGWVCRTRIEHLDWRPLIAAGLAEVAPALGHVRLTPLGWARAYAAATRVLGRPADGAPPVGNHPPAMAG